MSQPKRIVLITGCSEGGTGAALALAFHDAGLKVIATARNLSKMSSLERAGIETRALDIQSDSSIQKCVSSLASLDILVNNAGAGLMTPFADASIPRAKELFDLNVWAQVAITQACLPLLLKSKQAVIVNHTSGGSVVPMPFQAIYNASKSAFAMLSDCSRLELEAFNIKVVELKTGLVRTKFSSNANEANKPALREGSIYEPAREKVESMLRNEVFDGRGTDPEKWARAVVTDVLKKSPPYYVYQGDSAWAPRVLPMLPAGMLNGTIKKTVGLDEVERLLKEKRM